ncbi:MAG: ABC transporter ATP-binding protein [bacterium]
MDVRGRMKEEGGVTPMILAEELSGAYGERRVVESLSFSVERGEIYGVIGPNGSGKTTLIRLLSRYMPPRSGAVVMDGRRLGEYTLNALARKVAVVPQETVVEFSFTAYDIAAMGRTPYVNRLRFEDREDARVVEESMRATDTWELRGRFFNTLSGGEAQRVVIARCLAQKCEVMMLDEPTAHLDLKYQSGIFSLLRRLRDTGGITIVATTHDLNLASLYCDRLLLLNGGRKEVEGAPREVITAERIEKVYGAECMVFFDESRGIPVVYPKVQKPEGKEEKR